MVCVLVVLGGSRESQSLPASLSLLSLPLGLCCASPVVVHEVDPHDMLPSEHQPLQRRFQVKRIVAHAHRGEVVESHGCEHDAREVIELQDVRERV